MFNQPAEKSDLVHVHSMLPKSKKEVKKALKLGIPVVSHSHSFHVDLGKSAIFSSLLAPFSKGYFRWFYKHSDMVLSLNSFSEKLLLEYGVPEEKITRVMNPVDTKKLTNDEKKREQFREKLGVKNHEKIVFNMTHTFFRKGIDTFKDVAKKLPQHRFIWFGPKYNSLTMSNPIKHYLIIHKHGLKNLTFYGFVEDKIAGMSAGDILLFPSYSEIQPITILEALSMGKPVIVRDIPCYEGWLKHGYNALKAGSLEEFVEHVDALATDEKLYEKLSRQGREYVVENHDLDVIAEKMADVYDTFF